jgi:hypothetical protein
MVIPRCRVLKVGFTKIKLIGNGLDACKALTEAEAIQNIMSTGYSIL